jgi:hypothetical protein
VKCDEARTRTRRPPPPPSKTRPVVPRPVNIDVFCVLTRPVGRPTSVPGKNDRPPTLPGGLSRYIVITLVNIGRKWVFRRYKSRYRPSAEALQDASAIETSLTPPVATRSIPKTSA